MRGWITTFLKPLSQMAINFGLPASFPFLHSFIPGESTSIEMFRLISKHWFDTLPLTLKSTALATRLPFAWKRFWLLSDWVYSLSTSVFSFFSFSASLPPHLFVRSFFQNAAMVWWSWHSYAWTRKSLSKVFFIALTYPLIRQELSQLCRSRGFSEKWDQLMLLELLSRPSTSQVLDDSSLSYYLMRKELIWCV